MNLHDLLTISLACRRGDVPDDRVNGLVRLVEQGDEATGGDPLGAIVRAEIVPSDRADAIREAVREALVDGGPRTVSDLLVVHGALAGGHAGLSSLLWSLARDDVPLDSNEGSPGLTGSLVRAGLVPRDIVQDLQQRAEGTRVPCPACDRQPRLGAIAEARCPDCRAFLDLPGLLRRTEVPLDGEDSEEDPGPVTVALGSSAVQGAPGSDDFPSRSAPGPGDEGEGSRPAVYGDYEVVGRLGEGAMGAVYRARHREIGREVALKVMLAGGFVSEHQIRRFRREARAAASLRHPHIVPVHHYGVERGRPYLTMELVEGGSLADVLRAEEVDRREVLEIVRKTAEALHHAHEEGVVHRDVKPANILVDEEGSPYVSDFGLASAEPAEGEGKLTQTGDILGTPSYMAPEQVFADDPPDRRADVYALGVIVYEVITGDTPYEISSVIELATKMMQTDPVPPSKVEDTVDRDLETICLKALEKDPDRRYPTARALADDIGRWLAGEPIEARPLGRIEKTWRFLRRHPVATGVATTALLALCLWLGATTAVEWWRARRRAQLRSAAAGALETARDEVRATLSEARQALASGDPARAERLAREANRASSTEAVAGRTEEALRELGATEAERSRALAGVSPESDHLKAESLTLRGRARRAAGDVEEAVRDLITAYRVSPASPGGLEAFVGLGEHLLRSGKVARAVRVLTGAAGRLEAGPLRARALAGLGRGYALLERTADARAAYLQAASEVSDPDGHLGRMFTLRATILGLDRGRVPVPDAVGLGGERTLALDLDDDGTDELIHPVPGGIGVSRWTGSGWETVHRVGGPGGRTPSRIMTADADDDGSPDLGIYWGGDDRRVEVRPVADGRIHPPLHSFGLSRNPYALEMADVDGDGIVEFVSGHHHNQDARQRNALLWTRRIHGGWHSRRFFPPANEAGSGVTVIRSLPRPDGPPLVVLGANGWNHWELLAYDLSGSRPQIVWRRQLGQIDGLTRARTGDEEVLLCRVDSHSEMAVPEVFGPELGGMADEGVHVVRRTGAGELVCEELHVDPDRILGETGGGEAVLLETADAGTFLVTSEFESDAPGPRRVLDLVPVRDGTTGPPAVRVGLHSGSWGSWVSGDFDGDGRTDALGLGSSDDVPVTWTFLSSPGPEPDPLPLGTVDARDLSGVERQLQAARDLLYLGFPGEAAGHLVELVEEGELPPARRPAALLEAARALETAGDPDGAVELALRAADIGPEVLTEDRWDPLSPRAIRGDPRVAARALVLAARIEVERERRRSAFRLLGAIGDHLPLDDEDEREVRRLRQQLASLEDQEVPFEVPFAGPADLEPFRLSDPVRARLTDEGLAYSVDGSENPPVRTRFAYDGGPLTISFHVDIRAISWSTGFRFRLASVSTGTGDLPSASGHLQLAFRVRGGGSAESFERLVDYGAGAQGWGDGGSPHLAGYAPEGYDVTIRYLPHRWRAEFLLVPAGETADHPRALRRTAELDRLLPGGTYALVMEGTHYGSAIPGGGNFFGRVIVSDLRATAPADVLESLSPGERPPEERAALALAGGRTADAWAIYRRILEGGLPPDRPADERAAVRIYAALAAGRSGDRGAVRRILDGAPRSALETALATRVPAMTPEERAIIGSWLVRGRSPEEIAAAMQGAMRDRRSGIALLLAEQVRGARLDVGQALVQVGRYDEARELLEPPAERGDPVALYLLGKARYQQVVFHHPRDYDAIIELWERALEAGPPAALRPRIETELRSIRGAARLLERRQ